MKVIQHKYLGLESALIVVHQTSPFLAYRWMASLTPEQYHHRGKGGRTEHHPSRRSNKSIHQAGRPMGALFVQRGWFWRWFSTWVVLYFFFKEEKNFNSESNERNQDSLRATSAFKWFCLEIQYGKLLCSSAWEQEVEMLLMRTPNTTQTLATLQSFKELTNLEKILKKKLS